MKPSAGAPDRGGSRRDSLFPTSRNKGDGLFQNHSLDPKFFFIWGWLMVKIKNFMPEKHPIRNRIVF